MERVIGRADATEEIVQFVTNNDKNNVLLMLTLLSKETWEYFYFLFENSLNPGQLDEEYVPKVGMSFETVVEAGLFYKEYAKRAGFSTKIRNSNRCKVTKEVKNQLITCNREERWRSEVPFVEKTNPICGANCPARIYVHVDKKTRLCVFPRLFSIIHIHAVLIKLRCYHNIGGRAWTCVGR
ncbi:hypothetical protein PIB30_039207 [Stylosanthes scabra]|uniref:FAR1 domain-containing protein n=1 Tax=Stylosanthes scabra TaxID=79078 RepID=A0ABU6QEV8_9FABA|nr:hypothetical protein [Stylosanthes scabra]